MGLARRQRRVRVGLPHAKSLVYRTVNRLATNPHLADKRVRESESASDRAPARDSEGSASKISAVLCCARHLHAGESRVRAIALYGSARHLQSTQEGPQLLSTPHDEKLTARAVL